MGKDTGTGFIGHGVPLRHRLSALTGLLALLTVLSAMPAGARAAVPATTEQRIEFDIPAQDLNAALLAFAEAAGVQVFYDLSRVRGLRNAPVDGSMPWRQALNALLAGTGVTYSVEDGTVTLRTAAAEGGETVLGPVTVEGQGESAYGPVDGYIARRSATGTKTDTLLIETPRSISVVTAEEAADRGADEIGAALRYTAGVFAEQRGTDTTRQSAAVRGFYNRDAHMIYRDGLRGPTSALLHPDPDIYGLERIEVLRGPSSTMYGQNTPSGMIHTVTKRPTETTFAETEIHAGSFNQHGGKFDFGGPLADDKRYLFRLTGLARDGDTQIDFLEEKRLFIAPAFKWQPDAETSLTLLSHYQKDDTHQALALPALGTIFDNPNGQLSTSFFRGEPGFEFDNKETYSLGYLFDRSWGEAFALRHVLRFDQGTLDSAGIGQTGFQADNRTLNRIGFTNVHDVWSVTTDTNGQFQMSHGPAKHTVLIGMDYNIGDVSQESTCCFAVPALDAFNPVYGQPFTVGPITFDQDQDFSQFGLYLQDQVKLHDRLVLTLGGRHDWSSIDTNNNITGRLSKQNDAELTVQAGMNYLFDNGLAPYTSYAESFEPQSGANFAGEPFDPTTGTQYEAGVKFQPTDGNSFASVAVFQLTRQNVLTADPANVGFNVQTGEVRSRGFEAEARAEPFDGLNLIASYSYTRTKVTESNGADLDEESINIPDHLASLWARYSFQSVPLNGLEIGGGARYVGTSFGDTANSFRVPDFVLFDAALNYRLTDGPFEGLNFGINISNLFDEVHVTSCLNVNNCFFGTRRVVTGSIKYRW